MRPIPLDPNQPATFYRGSGRLAEFRGRALEPRPEDWIASTTARFGQAPSGLSSLPDGRLLADAIAADPLAWLGERHVDRHGANPALLVKLLDAGQRLPVHVHPDRRFAAAHLASGYGKTEAWIVLDAAPDAVVHLGFRRDVAVDELAHWVSTQDTAALLDTTNRIPVQAGDAILCPAGLPHAIGAGILLVELQEPTDFSVLLEWEGFALGPQDATLGLPFADALACVDRRAISPARLASLRGRDGSPRGAALPDEASAFFVAERVGGGDSVPPGFGVLIVTAGSGQLAGQWGSLPLARGATVVVPFAAGAGRLDGNLAGIYSCPV
ncbi:MAG TPA: type I phosphomannose isomerase catalytic subunit [Jatrophihabitantaceae bacterium]